jgi:hypothetical protein
MILLLHGLVCKNNKHTRVVLGTAVINTHTHTHRIINTHAEAPQAPQRLGGRDRRSPSQGKYTSRRCPLRRPPGRSAHSQHICPAIRRKSWRPPALKRTQRGADAAPGVGSQRARGIREPSLVLRAQQHTAAGLHALGPELCAVAHQVRTCIRPYTWHCIRPDTCHGIRPQMHTA